MSEAVLDDLRNLRELAWRSYVNAPSGSSEAYRQGKFEGLDKALRVVAAHLAAEPAPPAPTTED